MINKLHAILFLAIAVTLFATPLHAVEAASKKGETEFGFYMEFSYFNDRGRAWTGSEASFSTRLKADLKHHLYDDILLRAKAVWSPSVNRHTIGGDSFDKREARPEDVYMQFNGLMGHPIELRMGSVKVPFGHFDFMSFEERNRPIGFSRTREWDYGLRMDTVINKHSVSFAVINGDGIDGTDANSAKSVAIRVAYPAGKEESAYPKTLEITDYPNPLNSNPSGGFLWQTGVSAYVGNRYSTPIKIKNSHYGFDFKVDYSIISLKGQYSFLEGGFTNSGVVLSPEELSRAVTDTYPRGYSGAMELAVGLNSKTVITVMAEKYDPDSDSDNSGAQKTKTRLVIGARYEYRKDVSMAIFYTYNDDPGYLYVAENTGRGNDVYMLGVAARF
ncbi:MAG: hypothetical protein ACE5EN_03860 [Nitrospinota bacterium]